MPRASAARELPATREEVWRLLAAPERLADWWPGIDVVETRGRGLVPGARWHVHAGLRPTLFRRTYSGGMLLVREVEQPHHLSWTLTGDYADVDLVLDESGGGRTHAVLAVESSLLSGFGGALPRRALSRLHRLCQTAAAE